MPKAKRGEVRRAGGGLRRAGASPRSE